MQAFVQSVEGVSACGTAQMAEFPAYEAKCDGIAFAGILRLSVFIRATGFWPAAERRSSESVLQEAEDALAPLLRCLAALLKNRGGGLLLGNAGLSRLQGASAWTLAIAGIEQLHGGLACKTGTCLWFGAY